MNMLNITIRKRMAIAVMVAFLGAPLCLVQNVLADEGVINVAAGSMSNNVKIARGKPKTIHVDRDFFEIVVGDPEIANVTPLTGQSFYVLGHKLGTTGIALFDENKKLVGSFDVEVTYDTQQLNSALKQNLPNSEIRATTANGQVVLSGAAKDQVAADKANKIAKTYTEGHDVIDSVNVTSSQQVQLDVRFVEVSRQSVIEMGVKGAVNVGTGIGAVANSFLTVGQTGTSNAGQIVGQLLGSGFSVDLSIKALEERGLARRLAEPNLVARSGQKASFLAGGEFPIPVSQQNGVTTVEYKKYGVGLEFTPTVLSDGLISLDIAPEVSSIDTTNSIRVGNISVPGFIVRRAQTSVDLKDGQSFMIAGLLQTMNDVGIDKVPGIGNAPVIGSLFSSKNYQRRETDLVIIVTPHLVRPVDPSKKFALPTDGTLAPSTVDLFGSNIDEVKVSDINRAKSGAAKMQQTPNSGYFLDLPTSN